MKKLFIFPLCFLFCQIISAQKNDIITLDLAKAVKQPAKKVLLSEIATDIQYIPLETTNDCIIGNEAIISFVGEDIIVGEQQKRDFFRFNSYGELINKIGSFGQGPEEYTVGVFYMLDPEMKQIYIQEFKSLICYDFNGTFIRKLSTPNLNMGTCEILSPNYIVYSNNLYFENKNAPTQLYVIDGNGKNVKKWDGYIEKGKRYGLILTSRDYMYRYNNRTYFKPALENVVYQIESPKSKSVVMKFEVSDKGVDVSADETEVKKRGNFISVTLIKETEIYIFITYNYKNEMYKGLYNKYSKEFNNVVFIDDLAGGFDFLHAGKCDDDKLMCIWSAYHAKKLKRHDKALLSKRKRELDNLLMNLDEEDNPIVVSVKLKK